MFFRDTNHFRKQPRENSRTDWLKVVSIGRSGNTKTRAVDVMMARAKRTYILIIKVNKLFSLFFVAVFSKRNRKHVLGVSIEL